MPFYLIEDASGAVVRGMTEAQITKLTTSVNTGLGSVVDNWVDMLPIAMLVVAITFGITYIASRIKDVRRAAKK